MLCLIPVKSTEMGILLQDDANMKSEEHYTATFHAVGITLP